MRKRMADGVENKKNLRENMTERRNSLTDGERTALSTRIAERVMQSSFYRQCRALCVYQAFRGEVSCEPLLSLAMQEGRRVYAPVTDKLQRTMEFYQITEGTEWKKGAYGILEPAVFPDTPVLREPALILMPGLAFDRKKRRIGYGGGYYDRYLKAHPDHTTAALCYSFQIAEGDIPWEAHDILPDYIVTEQEII